jgi:hypothetical protein
MMLDSRDTNFAVCNIGQYVYVIGGSLSTTEVDACERFDVLSGKWSRLACKSQNPFVCEMAVTTLKKRYIYTFGGRSANNAMHAEKKEVFTRLDTLRMHRGWEELTLKPRKSEPGCDYGVMPLGPISDDKFEFLVFGGWIKGKGSQGRQAVFTTSIKDFAASTFIVDKKERMVRESAFDSETVALPSSTLTPQLFEDHVRSPEKRAQLANLTQPNYDLRAVLSDNGMHIFDKSSRQWIACLREQGFKAQK